jgi:excisionase family DNA binding protein
MHASTDTDVPRFVSVAEAAISLGVTVNTIRRWVRDGRLQATQPGGEQGVLRIPAAELERLADRARQTGP